MAPGIWPTTGVTKTNCPLSPKHEYKSYIKQTGRPQFTTVCLATISSYNSREKSDLRTSYLQLLYHPHSYVIKKWVLGNPYVFTTPEVISLPFATFPPGFHHAKHQWGKPHLLNDCLIHLTMA